jgi:tRNA(Ile)-lysidine synthase
LSGGPARRQDPDRPRPVGPDEFDRLMAGLGPFERAPALAVAVSGGADSLALALLAAGWARRRGGALTALTVDHGLRPAAAAEARQVARWLAGRGIAHRRLTWRGAKPSRNIQAAARAARYALMTDWCRRQGVLHLLLAHHRDDQAETLLLRLGRGSGVDGLAAMAPVAELADIRLLRPLLGTARDRLIATLDAAGQPWIEDPTNRDPAHARVRLRGLKPALAAEGLTAERLAATAGRLGRARAALESAVAALLAEAAAVYPAGHCRLDPTVLAAAPSEVALRALARALATIGGDVHGPRLDGLERLWAAIAAGRLGGGRTLAGCRVLPRPDGLLLCREPADIADERMLGPGDSVLWDGRFRVALGTGAARRRFRLGPLGREGWTELAGVLTAVQQKAVPAPVRPSLPALRRNGRLVAVPHFGYIRGAPPPVVRFEPARPLAGPVFFIANWPTGPISS